MDMSIGLLQQKSMLPIVQQFELLGQYAIPQTIVQTDFHTNNILIHSKTKTLTFIDLGEVIITNPLFSLHGFLRQAITHHNIKEQDKIYGITVYKDNVFFLPEFDAIVFVKIQGRELLLLDLFSKNEQNLDDIIHVLINEKIDTVRLGFVPMDCSSWKAVSIDEKEQGEKLFVESNKTALFDEHLLMFPLLSHA